jgi:hypothetical protein
MNIRGNYPKAPEVNWAEAIKELHEAAMKADTVIRRAQIADQLHQLLDEKRDEERGNMETTTLESGQIIDHHSKDKCGSNPCAIHNPTKGPWDDWPCFYNEDNGLIYRMCPHNVLHPCVEDAIRIVKNTTDVDTIVNMLAHGCCNDCVCMPRTGLPDQVFKGRAITFPLPIPAPTLAPTLAAYPGAPSTVTAQDGAPPGRPVPQVEQTLNPNKYLKDWLWIRRLEIQPMVLLQILYNDMLDRHEIREIDVFSTRVVFSCADDCEGAFARDSSDGTWNYHKTLHGHYCPTMAMALMAGFEPTEDWNIDDEEGD